MSGYGATYIIFELVNHMGQGLVNVGTLGGEGLNVHLVDHAIVISQLLEIVRGIIAKLDHCLDRIGKANDGHVHLGLAQADLLLVLGHQ